MMMVNLVKFISVTIIIGHREAIGGHYLGVDSRLNVWRTMCLPKTQKFTHSSVLKEYTHTGTGTHFYIHTLT